MINIEKTKAKFGYDPTGNIPRIDAFGVKKRKDLKVVDECPGCGKEREIAFKQSQKNTVCSKCFHSSPEMQEAKRNQSKIKSDETKKKMSENHRTKRGFASSFKGHSHTEEAKTLIAERTKAQMASYSEEYQKLLKIKESCTKRGIPLEEFNGFSASEGNLLRQSAEGKAWSYDVLAKSNFTCIKCNTRGGTLHAHHKNAFASFPEQRLDVDNGACLCDTCHNEFHVKYGKGSNTEDQFDDWVKS